jgi:ribonuclease HII
MAFLVGTDEAGYGPNLGPLVISASVWEVPREVCGDDLYQRLKTVIAPAAARSVRDAGQRVAITDSKVLYQSGKGLKLLERGLWAAWSLIDQRPAACGEVWERLTGPDAGPRREALCGGMDPLPAPQDFNAVEIDRIRPGLRQALAQAGVRLIGLHSIAIFPREFNDTVDRSDSKGAALSHWTLQLVARMIEPLGEEPIAILCDKHGGRDRYLRLLMNCFPDRFIEVVNEGRWTSVYRFGPAQRRVEIAFQAKGESHLPTALASMASKYLRELAMQAFNDFWRGHVADLRPTAGYAGDAPRFKADIATAQQSLGIDDRILWRTK